jgi:hypothetical protein
MIIQMTMPLVRRRPTTSGLIRLLADLPRERLAALAAAWDARPGDGGSLLPGLYRRMTDPEAFAAALRGQTDAARLILLALARAREPTSLPGLARRLPFDEDSLAAGLAELERAGLVWRRPADRGDEAAGERWLLPSELRDLVRAESRRRRKMTPRPAADEGFDPVPEPLPEAPGGVVPGGEVADLVTNLDEWRGTGPATQPERARYAEHGGIALGVWEGRGSGVVAGPRRGAWLALDRAGRRRALARLWLVDDAAPDVVPAPIRRATWQTLRRLAAGRWYGLDQLGHLAARLDGTRSIARRDLERALETLAWIGVVDRAIDRRGRLAGVRLSEDGADALN